ncbi:MAG: P-loop NTPase [Isosphaeraceae bacterium]
MACIDHEGFSALARDHATNPRNYGPLPEFDGHSRVTGPCGDTMEFWLIAPGDTVHQVSFTTDGCGSSLACGSMAATLAEGKRVEDAAALRQQDILDAFGGLPPETEHCALLAANGLKAACEDYLNRHGPSTQSRSDQPACGTRGGKDYSSFKHKNSDGDEACDDDRRLQSRLCRIRRKIVVLSGKGGVGKSTVAVNLATALMMSRKRVGLLDADIHGPSIPTMLDLENIKPRGSDDGLLPITVGDMKVMSLGFLLRNQDDAVIWRGPMKNNVIRQFLKDVVWGDLDYLIIDSPPGTGDEPLSVCQQIGSLDGAVIVTTPQKVAAVDVRKSITFCHKLHVPVLGVVENMSGFTCPKCGEVTPILLSGGGKRIAEGMGVPFLGSIPMDFKIAEACDLGQAFVHHYSTTLTAATMLHILNQIAVLTETKSAETTTDPCDMRRPNP